MVGSSEILLFWCIFLYFVYPLFSGFLNFDDLIYFAKLYVEKGIVHSNNWRGVNIAYL
jgi:hypothetical protein